MFWYPKSWDQDGYFDTHIAILWSQEMTFYDGHKCHKMSLFDIYDGQTMSQSMALWVSK